MSRSKLNGGLALAALGVVYGDIGTSPLYTLQSCFENITINTMNVLGVISLIFWSLILVISTCYLTIFLNASNRGEGGVLALLGLFNKKKKANRFLFIAGILGAGLLISDGMLTPAISVLSAMEGLNVISPSISHWIIPLTIIILLSLFFCQRFGPQTIGVTFGPILLIWFITIGAMGLVQIIQHPIILLAVNPYYGMHFFHENGFPGFLALGSIFLAITGAEAMYADLGQFGKRPIQVAWFLVVLPAVLLSFFGQGANLLANPSAVENPFYYIAPDWFGYPLLILAAMATIIASQAIISASFSLTKQGILLGVMPRLRIKQTSTEQKGQIYVPVINMIFAVGTIFLVLFFEKSARLTNAYGIAINLEMVIMGLLIICLAYQVWKWSIFRIINTFAIFVIIDLAFLASNIFKIPAGGWIPLVFASICTFIMITWNKGIQLLSSAYAKKVSTSDQKPVVTPIQGPLQKLSGLQAILITNIYDETGLGFFQYFDILQAEPSNWIMLTVAVKTHPFVDADDRFKFIKTKDDTCHLIINFGFMEVINIPEYLKMASENKILPFKLDQDRILYFVEYIALTAEKTVEMFSWQKRFFIFMFENTLETFAALDFFKLPRDRTVTIGTYAEL